MSHLVDILNKNKQLSTALMDGTEQVSITNEQTESWTSSNPHYASLMSKKDEITDFVNDFITDYQGKIADLVAIANGE